MLLLGKVVTPRRACAKQGLCDRLCPFIYLSRATEILSRKNA